MILFLKVHDAWKNTSSGESMFPAAITKAVVYFIKNPLDIAISFSYHLAQDIDSTIQKINSTEYAFCKNPKKNNQQVKQVLLDWSKHIISWVDESKLPILIIRYEDMLNDPSSSFRKALNFLDLKIDNKTFQNALNATEFSTLKSIEEEEGFIEKPIEMGKFFREGKAGTWEKLLSATQRDKSRHTINK